jgi:uncharacterized protein
MKYFIASDIHGSAEWCRRFVEAARDGGAERMILLGDILYHGPRNNLPQGYDPKQVIELLNPLAEKVIAVRGNCDAEVDQMVLSFSCMADYSTLIDSEAPNPRTLFLTHGHVYGPGIDGAVEAFPNLPEGSALLYGHTHVKVNGPSKAKTGLWLFNPGSLSLPKDGSHSFGIYETGKPIDQAFQHVLL